MNTHAYARDRLPQVRYLTRTLTAEEYDEAVRSQPETCPMHYMGDRRTGRQVCVSVRACVYKYYHPI